MRTVITHQAGLPAASLPARITVPTPRTVQKRLVCRAANPEGKTEVVFEPFQAVKGELTTVENLDNTHQSFARLDYHEECEAAVNEQINIEYNISYVYHALHAFFDRDNVGLPGLAKYFKDGSDEERDHAQLLVTFQNIRGGRVKLSGIVSPEMEYNHPEKGDALHAMELALSLEKLNFSKLRLLHDIACKHNDAHMADFIEGELLQDQARAVKENAVYVSMLRRLGKGHGTWHFDRYIRGDATPVPALQLPV
jgi:ferritin heavy chain